MGTQGMTGENLGEITISLILGETTNAQRRSAQYTAIENSKDAAEAKEFLFALGLLQRYPDD